MVSLDSLFVEKAKEINKIICFESNFMPLTNHSIQTADLLSHSTPLLLELYVGFVQRPADREFYFVNPDKKVHKIVNVFDTRYKDYQVELLERITKYVSKIPKFLTLNLGLPEELRSYVNEQHIELLGKPEEDIENSPIYRVGFSPDQKKIFCDFLMVGGKN